jgi:hypothetical protein
MRIPHRVLSVSLLLVASAASAQEKHHTNAQLDGFLGPVKSVSTVETVAHVKWQQPSGPTLVWPVSCWDCTYVSDGSKTRSGQTVNGSFRGQFITLHRDVDGHIIDRVFTDAATGNISRREVMGRFGRTEETDYDESTGIVRSQQFISYDQYGHTRDIRIEDKNGNLESQIFNTRLEDGTLINQSVFGKTGKLERQVSDDPARNPDHFISYDDSGAVNEEWTFSRSGVFSFWEQPNPQQPLFESINEDESDGIIGNFNCHKDGECEHSHVYLKYLGPSQQRNPSSIEWRNADGTLHCAAYYEYEFDHYGNWTHRNVAVYSTELGERVPYQDDVRTITYWQQ